MGGWVGGSNENITISTQVKVVVEFYILVKYYPEHLSFKFHEDLCTNARAQVVNERTRDKTHTRVYKLCARILCRDRKFLNP